MLKNVLKINILGYIIYGSLQLSQFVWLKLVLFAVQD